MIYSTEKTLAEAGDKIDPNTRAQVERAAEDLKRAVQGDNADEIKRLTENLSHATHAMAQAMYQQQSGASAGRQSGNSAGNAYGPASSGSEDEVVDAEYEEVN